MANCIFIVHSCSFSDRELEQNIIGVTANKEKAIELAKMEYEDCCSSMAETYGEDCIFSSQIGEDCYEVREIDDKEIWEIEITKQEINED